MAKVTFLGLGVMGYPMAGHVKNSGMEVCVYNRTTEKAQRWVEEYEGHMALSPAKAAFKFSSVFDPLSAMFTPLFYVRYNDSKLEVKYFRMIIN